MTNGVEPTYPERDLTTVERAFERLLAQGELVVEHARAEDLRRAALPTDAAQFLRLARRFKSVKLVVAEITFHLDRCTALDADPALGAWSIATDSPELDIRLGHPQSPDAVFDLTWSPGSGAEAIVHSTFLHFIVRSAAGDAA